MARHTLYELLEVSPTATADDIRAAYRRLSLATHPDRGGSAALFDLINVAFRTLTDEDQRRAYDRSLREPLRPRPPTPQEPRASTDHPSPPRDQTPPGDQTPRPEQPPPRGTRQADGPSGSPPRPDGNSNATGTAPPGSRSARTQTTTTGTQTGTTTRQSTGRGQRAPVPHPVGPEVFTRVNPRADWVTSGWSWDTDPSRSHRIERRFQLTARARAEHRHDLCRYPARFLNKYGYYSTPTWSAYGYLVLSCLLFTLLRFIGIQQLITHPYPMEPLWAGMRYERVHLGLFLFTKLVIAVAVAALAPWAIYWWRCTRAPVLWGEKALLLLSVWTLAGFFEFVLIPRHSGRYVLAALAGYLLYAFLSRWFPWSVRPWGQHSWTYRKLDAWRTRLGQYRGRRPQQRPGADRQGTHGPTYPGPKSDATG